MTQSTISSDNQNPTPIRHAGLRYMLVGLMVFVLVALCGLIAAKLRRDAQNKPAATVETFHETPTTPAEKSYAAQLNGDYNQAYKILDEALAKASSDSEKASLYNEKSIAALNAKDYLFALDMAKQSEKLRPSVSSAHIIAESSEQLGDKKTAAAYIKKQVERIVTSGNPYIQEDVDALKQKITQLETAP